MQANLAALRYRGVCGNGGPISVIETGRVNVRGREAFQANAILRDDLAPRRGARLFSPVDGSGTHRTAVVARHMAVSEAIERWALLTVLKADGGQKYGFGVDPTSNGMAAFPGMWARQARRFAWLEAVERYCLFGWWEGRLRGRFFQSKWEDVSGVEIEGPFQAEGRGSARVVVLFAQTGGGRYAYGHAAGENLTEAQERAIIELCRHQVALDNWDEKLGGGGDAKIRERELGRMERRSLFFSTPQGFAEFWLRVEAAGAPDRDRPVGSGRGSLQGFRAEPQAPLRAPELIFDGEIPGPWARYAHVWRVVFRPPSRRFLEENDEFFFW